MTRIHFMMTDHRPPYLVRADDVRFGLVYLPPSLDARCPSCGDRWPAGMCPACREWYGSDPDVDSPAPPPWDGGQE